MKPVLLVVAGPNGAGKTTVTARLRAERWSEGVEYLNPDEIARARFGDWNSPDAVLKAAEWTKERREARLCARTQDSLLRKIYGALPQWMADAVAPLERHPDFDDLGPPTSA